MRVDVVRGATHSCAALPQNALSGLSDEQCNPFVRRTPPMPTRTAFPRLIAAVADVCRGGRGRLCG